jgi:hypothetical protein
MRRAIIITALLLTAAATYGGELLPYQPPTFQAEKLIKDEWQAPVSERLTITKDAWKTSPSQRVTVSEDVFEKFNKDVKALTAQQREELKSSLEKTQATAKIKGDLSREAFYGRLVESMEKVKP